MKQSKYDENKVDWIRYHKNWQENYPKDALRKVDEFLNSLRPLTKYDLVNHVFEKNKALERIEDVINDSDVQGIVKFRIKMRDIYLKLYGSDKENAMKEKEELDKQKPILDEKVKEFMLNEINKQLTSRLDWDSFHWNPVKNELADITIFVYIKGIKFALVLNRKNEMVTLYPFENPTPLRKNYGMKRVLGIFKGLMNK